ncbi:hypothetical protein F4814DRAFT_456781 [Daldinia grandis]|nr:hypothetical protein F4814DRAFT_456781 [Daldinia grandis]
MLGGIVGQGRQAAQPSASTERKAQGLTFDDLPLDVKFSIFEMVGLTPSWVHFGYKRGKLVEFWGGNQEVYVNKEWHEARQLQLGLGTLDLSTNKPVSTETLAEGILRFFSKDQPGVGSLQQRHRGDPRFSGRNNDQPNPVPIRREIDWFFFDNCVNTSFRGRDWSMPQYIHNIRTCVFSLDNIFDGTTFNHHPIPPPDYIWPECSHIEELIILVGRFRKEVPPSQMKVMLAFQVSQLATADVISDHKEMMFGHENAQYAKYVLRSEIHMIGEISRLWSMAFTDKEQLREEWLYGRDGLRWLAYPVHDNKNEFSIWLATPRGYQWLEYGWERDDEPGFRFLASESGWWWLASDFGFPWLETKQGLRWLGTKNGQRFINSQQALLWVNTGTYNPSSFTPLGTQVRKAWFGTAEGVEWKFRNCPGGNPPAPPQPPQRSSYPPPNVEFPIYFKNPHFKGWRFVICPEEIAERARSHRK